MVRPWLVIVILICAGPGFAAVPVTGRTQHMLFPRAAVETAATLAYHHKLARLDAQGQLDSDRNRLDRIRHLCSRLIAQAILLKPEAAHWPWEIHITSNPQVTANSMAGGKLLVGTQFIDDYKLNDDELAVVLAHEIGHVIAEHVREQMSRVTSLETPPPNRTIKVADVINAMESDISVLFSLQPLSRLQEIEADDIGIELAARAGVSPSAVVSFYTKLTQGEARQSIFNTHGPANQRQAFVTSMADYARPVYEANRSRQLPRYTFVNQSH